jgi:hypothetical protein
MQHLIRIFAKLSFGTELLLANYINLVRWDTASLRIHIHLFDKEDTLKKFYRLWRKHKTE